MRVLDVHPNVLAAKEHFLANLTLILTAFIPEGEKKKKLKELCEEANEKKFSSVKLPMKFLEWFVQELKG